MPGDFYPNCSSPNSPHTRPHFNNTARMEVVGWSPSEELQDPDMFHIPPQVEGWTGAQDGESSKYAGPSSYPFPRPSSPRFESATVHQRRLKDPNHVRRPRNAFIIYRCDFIHKYIANGGSERTSDTEKTSLSKRAGVAWKNEMPETVRHYKKLADEERALHRAQHPDYRFRPKRQKSAGQAGRSRSPKRRTSSPGPKRVAGRSSSVSVECNQASRNDPLQIQTIIVPTSSSTLSQSHLSRQPTPDFFHGYGSATPTSPCSPLSPVDDTLYMPRPTIAGRSDSLMSYTADDSQLYGYAKDPLAPFTDDFSLFGQAFAAPDPTQLYNYPPLAAVASSLVGWDGHVQGQKADMSSPTPRPFLQHESDYIDPFLSLALSDGNMGYFGVPFGPDPLCAQYDMDAYRMGLKEYGIPPAGNQ